MAKKAGRKKDERSAWKSVYDEPPRKHVLLLTCMDQRLLDDTVAFMNELNLHNRYDQVIFAGSAMGARRMPGSGAPWKPVFFAHLSAAINVLRREIKDIFLIEHLDCGAYRMLHPDETIRKKYATEPDLTGLVRYHRDEVLAFAQDVREYCEEQRAKAANDATIKAADWTNIRVRSFVMDLVGNVREFDDDGSLHDIGE